MVWVFLFRGVVGQELVCLILSGFGSYLKIGHFRWLEMVFWWARLLLKDVCVMLLIWGRSYLRWQDDLTIFTVVGLCWGWVDILLWTFWSYLGRFIEQKLLPPYDFTLFTALSLEKFGCSVFIMRIGCFRGKYYRWMTTHRAFSSTGCINLEVILWWFLQFFFVILLRVTWYYIQI